LKPAVKRYFVTKWWRTKRGIVELEGRRDNYGYISNTGFDTVGRGEWFHGKLGYSAFETRAEADEAVKKKAAVCLRRAKRDVAFLEGVIANGLSPAVAP
jgi:hypothetical protein